MSASSKRQTLEPAIGQVADVERRDVQLVHLGSAPSMLRVRAAIGQGEREGRSDALGRLDPDRAAVLLDDVAGDGQAEPGPAGLAPDPRPVHLVEALEDPGLGGPRDADAVVGDRGHDASGHRPGPRPSTSPPSGLNLTALWSRLTRTWPSRSSSPWTGGSGG